MFEPPSFHPHRPGVVAPVRVDSRGQQGPTRAQARRPAWRRSSQGYFVPSWVDPEAADQQIVEAAVALPSYGGVTGTAMLRWAGGRWFSPEAGVVLAIGGLNVRPQPGVHLSKERLDPRDLTVIDGLRVTTPVRSVCYEMRYARSLLEAVTVLDMAAYADLVSIEELTAYALEHPGWTGVPQCRDAIARADENAWSPMEVEMRWRWSDGTGLPVPLTNRPVFDSSGRHLGTPDLIDPAAGVVGEYDGAVHLAGQQRAKDLDRESGFRAVGLEYVTMVAADRRDPTQFLARLRGAYDRSRPLSEKERRWTLTTPSWWVPTTTVEQRRGLNAAQRRRLLAYRRAA